MAIWALHRGAAIVAASAVAVLAWPRAAASEPGPPSRFEQRRWTVVDGLPQSSVTGVAQDGEGYLWLTTFGGVARFDGTSFEVYDLATRPELGTLRFVGLAATGDGELIVGAQHDALLRVRGTAFSAVPLPPEVRGAVLPPVSAADGTVWTGVGATLVQIDGPHVYTQTSTTLAALELTRVHVDPRGGVWVVATRGVLCVAGPCGKRSVVLRPTEAWAEAAMDEERPLVWDARWGPLSRCPRATGEFVLLFRWSERTWCADRTTLTSSERPPAQVELAGIDREMIGVYTRYRDRQGALWIGTAGGGLVELRDRRVVRYGVDAGLLLRSVWSLGRDAAGRLWLEQAGKVRVLSDGTARPPPPAIEALGTVDALTADPDGGVWLVAAGELYRVEGERAAAVTHGELPRARVKGLWVLDGAVWLAVEGEGLLRWRAGVVEARWSERDLGGAAIVVRRAPGGVVWVGTRAGLVRLDGVDATPVSGFPNVEVRDVFVPGSDDAVWAGTYGAGLVRVQGGALARVNRAHGLCDDVVSRIIEDGAGTLWMNGNRGVFRVSRAELRRVADGTAGAVHCSLLDSGEGNGNGGLVAADGRMWFPTTTGVASVDPREPFDDEQPKARLASLTLGGRPVADGAQFRSNGDDLEAEFTALTLLRAKDVHFRYRLNFYEDTYQNAGTRRSVRYTKLPPGDYSFELQAKSSRGGWGESVFRRFTVVPRLWGQTRFWVACAALALALTWGLATLRTRAVEHRNRALSREIEERERVTRALRAEEAHYRALFEGTSDGLFVHATDGRLLELNPAASAMVGLEPHALSASWPLGHVDPSSHATYRALLSGELRAPVDARLVARDGSALEVRLTAAPLAARGGARVLVSAVDLTAERTAERERAALERQLRQSQKLEALGQLAGGIAHDFNNLLTAVGMEVSLVRGADADDLEAVRNIKSAVERAAALTKKLLVFGRQDSNKPVVLTLQDRARELMAVLRRTLPSDIELTLEAHQTPLRARIDPVRLEQMIINLVVNARDAIVGPGRIAIRIEHVELDVAASVTRGGKPGHHAVLTVADTGTGIAPGLAERIFEPFFTTKEVGKGSGLGLAIVHAAVREAGGFVTVESKLGAGATFRLHFPLVEALPEPAEARDEPMVGGDGATILLCDDEPAVLQVAARALRRAGYRVLEAESPEAALALFESEPAPVELLVTDVVMPGMSGAELARRARERSADLPVLFISGHQRDVVLDRGVEGAAELLAKPFTMDTLVRRVGSIRRRMGTADLPVVSAAAPPS